MLSRGVGTSPGLQTDTVPVVLAPDTRLLLCSQNLAEIVPENEILAICAKDHVVTSVQGLVAAALKREVVGNVTAVMVTGGSQGESKRFLTMDMRVHLLGHCFMFNELNFQEIALLLSIVDVVSFSRGDIIFSEGDRGDEFYVIIRGEVSVRKGATELTRLGPGAPFGELSLILDPVRTATLVALEHCSMLRITRAGFEMLRRTRPALAGSLTHCLLKHLGERVRNLTERYD